MSLLAPPRCVVTALIEASVAARENAKADELSSSEWLQRGMFSAMIRAAVQILGLYAIPKEKMKTFDVLEDQELRTGIKEFS